MTTSATFLRRSLRLFVVSLLRGRGLTTGLRALWAASVLRGTGVRRYQVGLAGICLILRNRRSAGEKAQRPRPRYWKLSLRLLAEPAVSVVQVPLVGLHRRAYRHLERVRMLLAAWCPSSWAVRLGRAQVSVQQVFLRGSLLWQRCTPPCTTGSATLSKTSIRPVWLVLRNWGISVGRMRTLFVSRAGRLLRRPLRPPTHTSPKGLTRLLGRTTKRSPL